MYGKLMNGEILYAPSVLTVGDTVVVNPTAEMLSAAGYVPVVHTAPPETDGNSYVIPQWTEQEGQIIQSWRVEHMVFEPTADQKRIAALEEEMMRTRGGDV